MKLYLTFIVLIITLSATAQTKSKTTVDDIQEFKEKYEVLKADEMVKEGKYELLTVKGGKIVYKGYFKDNLPDSIWNYYGYNGRLSAKGTYKNGVRTGVWETHDQEGALLVKYDFNNGTMLQYKPVKQDSVTKKYTVIQGADTTHVQLDRPPIYLPGQGTLALFVVTNMRYPKVALENDISGKVLIGVSIDDKGVMTGYRVKRTLGGGCDEEAMRAMKRVRGEWLPAQLNGKNVSVEYELPISFALAKY